jgi:hypothetical protein
MSDERDGLELPGDQKQYAMVGLGVLRFLLALLGLVGLVSVLVWPPEQTPELWVPILVASGLLCAVRSSAVLSFCSSNPLVGHS